MTGNNWARLNLFCCVTLEIILRDFLGDVLRGYKKNDRMTCHVSGERFQYPPAVWTKDRGFNVVGVALESG
jgi:hypothetical protein